MTERRFFTVAEVNALLPGIRHAAEMVKEGSTRLDSLSKKLFEGDQPGSETLVDADYLTGIQALMKGVETIGQLGGELKDYSTGLVDFPSLHQGQEVLLCWMVGEEKVGYWHDLESGFAGRSVIENESDFSGDAGQDVH